MHESKYYGIYRGVVVDALDPKEVGRIKMMVPQVSGEEVTDWAWPIGGTSPQAKTSYGNFSSSQTQTNPVSNTENLVTFDTVEDSMRASLVSGTKITVNQSGDYFFQFSAQFASSTSSSAQADIWLKKNGVNIDRTNSRATLQGNPNEVLLTLNYILDLVAGDYIEIAFSSASTNVKLAAYSSLTSPTRPALPSVIATINLISNYSPNPGDGVWAAFEGGDPNFPLWIGTF